MDYRSFKYSLRNENQTLVFGEGNLSETKGTLIDTDGMLLVFVHSGHGIAQINSKRMPLTSGNLSMIFSDVTFCIESHSRDFRVNYISFDQSLVEHPSFRLNDPLFWKIIYETPVLSLDDKQQRLFKAWLESFILIVTECNSRFRLELIDNKIFELLAMTASELGKLSLSNISLRRDQAWKLLNEFYNMLPKYCHINRDVKFYADRLSITTSYLFKLCRRKMQDSPKRLIERQTIAEIKSYLSNTALQIKEIAEKMNFDDDSYMCRFFKRAVGLTPEEYRKAQAIS